jgi:hypothetical protein
VYQARRHAQEASHEDDIAQTFALLSTRDQVRERKIGRCLVGLEAGIPADVTASRVASTQRETGAPLLGTTGASFASHALFLYKSAQVLQAACPCGTDASDRHLQ